MIAKVRQLKSFTPLSSGEKLFTKVAAFYAATYAHVERVTLFGFDCLRTGGKVFIKVHNGDVILKLPAARIAALIGAGKVRPYERGRGLGMKEWAVVTTNREKLVLALVEEARVFVGG